MRVQVYRTLAITSVVYGRNAENEPVSRIKMADYSSEGSDIVSLARLSRESGQSGQSGHTRIVKLC